MNSLLRDLAAGSPGHGEVATRFYHWGVVQISLANLIVIIAMVLIFVLALLLPFPHGRNDEPEERADVQH